MSIWEKELEVFPVSFPKEKTPNCNDKQYFERNSLYCNHFQNHVIRYDEMYP